LAKLTLTVRPPISAWFIASMAFSAASLVWKATKPNPLGAKPLSQEAAGGRVRHVGEQDAGHGSDGRHVAARHGKAMAKHQASGCTGQRGPGARGETTERTRRGAWRGTVDWPVPTGPRWKNLQSGTDPRISHHSTARVPRASQRAASQNRWERGREPYLLRPVSRSKTTLACSISPNSWKTCQQKNIWISATGGPSSRGRKESQRATTRGRGWGRGQPRGGHRSQEPRGGRRRRACSRRCTAW
jgi:hypothetical protein